MWHGGSAIKGMSTVSIDKCLKGSQCIERTFGVPRAQDDAAIRGVLFNFPDAIPQLVNTFPRIILFTIDIFRAKMPPLEAIYGAKISLPSMSQTPTLQKCFGAIPIPDLDALLG